MQQQTGTDGGNLTIQFTISVDDTLPTVITVLKPGFGYGGNCTWSIPANGVVGNTAVTVSVAAANISAQSEAIPIPNTPNTCLLYTSPSPRDS